MATFLPEENQSLKGKSFEMPKYLKKHLNQYSDIKQQYSDSPGFKKLQHLIDPSYNDRSKGKKTQGQKGVPYGSLKRLKNAFDYSEPNGIEYNLMGGEEMRNWVNDTLNRERTKVKPVLPQSNNNKTKPSKPSVNQVKEPKPSVKENKKTIKLTEKQIFNLKQLLK